MVKTREGGLTATWERDVKIIFCDLCLKEIDLGNRPTTHFNRDGWKNLMINFQEKTGREYDKAQLKNKWDQLKKDWKLWKELKRGSTGLGWDPKRKTIDASDEWWKEKFEVIPNAKKFRYCGIDPELEEKLDLMFMGVVATGANAWTPSQVVEDVDRYADSEHIHDPFYPLQNPIDNIDDVNECNNSKRKKTSSSIGPRKKKHGSTYLRNQIDQLVNACTQFSSISTTSHTVFAPPSISDAIKFLDENREIFENIPLYLYATKLLEDPTKREIFMSMFEGTMFHLSKIRHTLHLHPQLLGLPLIDAIKGELEIQFLDKVIANLGLCISVYDILSIDGGFIFPGDGCSSYEVVFRLVMFRPFVGEILTGKIEESNNDNLRLSLGFFNDIYVPVLQLQQPCKRGDDGIWLWDYISQELPLDLNEEVHFQVISVNYPPIPVKQDPNSKPFAPMEIVAGMRGDGLGVVSWWRD